MESAVSRHPLCQCRRRGTEPRPTGSVEGRRASCHCWPSGCVDKQQQQQQQHHHHPSACPFCISICDRYFQACSSSSFVICFLCFLFLFFFLKSVFGVLLCCLHSVTRGSNKFSHVGIFDVYILRTAVSSGSRGRYSWLGDALLCKLQAARGNRLQQTLSATNRSNRES